MWIGSMRLTVETKNAPHAGTDSLVQVNVLRDGMSLRTLNLDYPAEDDLERGAHRNYNYLRLPRENDQTPELPSGVGQNPMPYPGYGFEFSNGLSGHLTLRVRIGGDDMWIKDRVDLYVRSVRRVATSWDTLDWIEDATWSYVASWTRDVKMSRDSGEGYATLDLQLG